jgi:hypothetical protein
LSSLDPVVAAVAGQELDRELDELERKIAARNAGALSIGSIAVNGLVSFFASLSGRQSQYTWDKDLDLVKIAHPAFGKIFRSLSPVRSIDYCTLQRCTMQMN